MAFDYQRAQATAERLIANFGATASLVQLVDSGDEWNPTRTPQPAVTIIVVDLDQMLTNSDGRLIQSSMRTLYVSTSAGVVPQGRDKITIKGTEHEIDEVAALNPANTNVFFEVTLKA